LDIASSLVGVVRSLSAFAMAYFTSTTCGGIQMPSRIA